MYYYGYGGAGYGNTPYYYPNAYNAVGGYGGGYNYSAAIILVLFILLVVIFGAGFINNGHRCCDN